MYAQRPTISSIERKSSEICDLFRNFILNVFFDGGLASLYPRLAKMRTSRYC